MAPTKEIMDGYKSKQIDRAAFEAGYLGLLRERKVEELFPRDRFVVPTVLLCSEPSPKLCHRKLAAEYLASKWGEVRVVHL